MQKWGLIWVDTLSDLIAVFGNISEFENYYSLSYSSFKIKLCDYG